MHARPFNRLARPVALAHGLKERAVGVYLRMTIHAGLRRRYARDGRRFDGRVAVAAVNPFVADVVAVPELHGLFAREVGLRVVGRAREFGHQPERDTDEEYRAEDADPRYDVRASMKDLAHYLFNPGRKSLDSVLRELRGGCAQSCDAYLPESGVIWICPTRLNTVA